MPKSDFVAQPTIHPYKEIMISCCWYLFTSAKKTKQMRVAVAAFQHACQQQNYQMIERFISRFYFSTKQEQITYTQEVAHKERGTLIYLHRCAFFFRWIFTSSKST